MTVFVFVMIFFEMKIAETNENKNHVQIQNYKEKIHEFFLFLRLFARRLKWEVYVCVSHMIKQINNRPYFNVTKNPAIVYLWKL